MTAKRGIHAFELQPHQIEDTSITTFDKNDDDNGSRWFDQLDQKEESLDESSDDWEIKMTSKKTRIAHNKDDDKENYDRARRFWSSIDIFLGGERI